jgi:hypothetical protein
MPHDLRTVNWILAIPGIRNTIPGIYLASKSPLAYDALWCLTTFFMKTLISHATFEDGPTMRLCFLPVGIPLCPSQLRTNSTFWSAILFTTILGVMHLVSIGTKLVRREEQHAWYMNWMKGACCGGWCSNVPAAGADEWYAPAVVRVIHDIWIWWKMPAARVVQQCTCGAD